MTTQPTCQPNKTISCKASAADTLNTETESPYVALEMQESRFLQAQTNHSSENGSSQHIFQQSELLESEIALSTHSLRGDLLLCKSLNNGFVPTDLQEFSDVDESADNSNISSEIMEMGNTTSQARQEHMSRKNSSSQKSCNTMIPDTAGSIAKTTTAMQQQNESLQCTKITAFLPVISSPQIPVSQPTSRDHSIRQYFSSACRQDLISENPLAITDCVDGNQDAATPVLIAYCVGDKDYQSRIHEYQMLRIRRFLGLSVYLLFVAIAMYFVITRMKMSNDPKQETTLLFNLTQHNPQAQLIVSIMGADAAILNNKSSPYTKALIWLLWSNERNKSQQTQDSLAQRFYAAVLYFGTTTAVNKWTACNFVYNHSDRHNESCYLPKPPNDDDSDDASSGLPKQAWLSDSHECDWAGVYCDGYQQIIGLELYDMNLVGVFPESVVKFPFLSFLSFEQSQLSGKIPLLSDFHHLVSLYMMSNLFSGDLSSTSIWQNRKLKELDIGNNRLTGTLSSQIGNCVDLKWLSLTINQMTGTLPSEVGLLDSIFWFDISINDFRGSFVPSLQSWSMIGIIDIGKNSFTGSIPTFLGQFNKTLEELHFSVNKFKGRLPDEIFQLSNLVYLDISDNELNGMLDARLGQFNASLFETLDISGNHFSGTIPTEIGLLTSLEYISLENNSFTGSIPSSLCMANSSKEISADCAKDENGWAELQCDCCIYCE